MKIFDGLGELAKALGSHLGYSGWLTASKPACVAESVAVLVSR